MYSCIYTVHEQNIIYDNVEIHIGPKYNYNSKIYMFMNANGPASFLVHLKLIHHR